MVRLPPRWSTTDISTSRRGTSDGMPCVSFLGPLVPPRLVIGRLGESHSRAGQVFLELSIVAIKAAMLLGDFPRETETAIDREGKLMEGGAVEVDDLTVLD